MVDRTYIGESKFKIWSELKNNCVLLMFWVKFSVGQNILMWTMQIMADDEQYNQHITTRKIGKNMRKIQAIE